MEEQRITKTRVFMTGTLTGLLWKKSYLYTVIDYTDENEQETIVLDFHKSAEKAQGLIYQKMIDAKKHQSVIQQQHETNSETRKTNDNKDDPLNILKIRLAKGQITKEEYEEMRNIIESQ